MSELKAGDFVKHTEDGSVGYVIGKFTYPLGNRNINCVWLFGEDSNVTAYFPEHLIKIRKTKKLIERTKLCLCSVNKNKKIDNLTYVELLFKLK